MSMVFNKSWTGIYRQNIPLLLTCSSRRRYASTKKAKTKIGFIGLGNMGSPMAKNIISKGHDVIVYDVQKDSMTDLQEHGAEISSSPKDVAEKVDCIITMLASNDIVLDVYQGKQGILKSVKKGTLLIDSSTVNPQIPKTLAKSAEEKEAVFIDAPVSGGVNAARLGQLTFMVGGPTESFPSVQEVLFTMGSRVVHCGPVGSGQASKICNNMLLGISMIGTAEAMTLGVRLGLDPKILLNIFNSSTGRCWPSEVYSPVPGTMENVPSANNYQGGFGTKLMSKDLGIAQEVAAKTTTPTPLGSLAHEMYKRMAKKGYAEKDFSSIYEFLKDQKRE